MKTALTKSAFRTIRSGLSRFLAIFAITALGVGFFAGLKTCKPAMLRTAKDYLETACFYDYRLISTIGFTEEEIAALASLPGIGSAEGGVFADFIAKSEAGEGEVLSARSLPETVNKLSLTAGRLPEKSGECVLDARYYGEEMLGKTLSLSDSNDDETFASFAVTSFTVVGLANSPLYLNYERGSTSLGKGTVDAFVFLLREDFTAAYAYEAYLTLAVREELYSDAYRTAVNAQKSAVEPLAAESLRDRFDKECAEAKAALEESAALLAAQEERLTAAEKELDEKTAAFEAALPFLSEEEAENAKKAIDEAAAALAEGKEALEAGRAEWDQADRALRDAKPPVLHLLTREENVGYVCFENDASIVEGIAAVFPVFFFLIAALVCLTTMTRMVSEERGEIGTLKSLGYSDFSIAGKYLLYSGAAALSGCVVGFFAGSVFIPRVIWSVYKILYGFAPLITVVRLPLGLLCLFVAALCSVGATYAAVRHELTHVPAALMRPKAPKNGKRIFLEKLPFWKRLSFLKKVSARNLFRYKKRVVMMVLGIGGCTALLLTGFGIRDSITGILPKQFDEISVYDYSLVFSESMDEAAEEEFLSSFSGRIDKIAFLHESVQTVSSEGGASKSAHIVTSSGENFTEFFHLREDGKTLPLPQKGEAVISQGLAERLSLSVGDPLRILYNNETSFTVTVSGLAENYVYYYVYLDEATLAEAIGEVPKKTAYLNGRDEEDEELAAALAADGAVASVSVTKDLRTRVENMLDSLDAIVWLVIGCAGVLAFIVLYNLTNINITEREREIATLKVLGFYPGETARYVFRENYLLTLLGGLAGLLAGKFLHLFVMRQIQIDLMTFDIRISPVSILISMALTFVFALLVSLAMRRRLAVIDMTSSLKSVE